MSFAEFNHPGLLHSQADLDRMKAGVAAEQGPIYEGFKVLAESPFSRADYRLRGPFREWGRQPDIRKAQAEDDANAAYQNALMWAITGNRDHANKCIQIINAWCSTLKRVSGIDGVLASGLQGFKFANAAEILRYTDSGWSDSDAKLCEKWLMDVWYPVIQDYALFANANWDAAALRTIMAIAVFCNDRVLFESTVRYAVNGAGNGRITHTIVYPTGQTQETTRQQGYVQLGLGLLSSAAEVAWNQGVDLYRWEDNRILGGFEYTAQYGLGEDVPYQHYLDRTGKYGYGGRHNNYNTISPKHRGSFYPIYEQCLNHYVNRRGLRAPYITRVVEQIRPEGGNRDHAGYGTVTHWRPILKPSKATRPPACPAGLVARTTNKGIRLTWVRSVEPVSGTDARSYTVKRATSSGGPYTAVGSRIPDTHFDDTDVQRGSVYYYIIIAENEKGEGGASVELAAGAGLPYPWTNMDIGDVGVAGNTEYNGRLFSMEGEGSGISALTDHFQFAYTPMKGDGVITARIVQPLSSQWSTPGVMMRENLDSGSRHASVLLLPHWSGALVARSMEMADTAIAGQTKIGEPYVVARDRLMAPYWVRLTRCGDLFTGYISSDGMDWMKLESVAIPMSDTIYVGLPACSQLNKVTTTVTYDNVAVSARSSALRVVSPDGHVEIAFVLGDKGRPAYKINYMGSPIVFESQMGFEPDFKNAFELVGTVADASTGQWTNDFGERRIVPDEYHELNVDLRHASGRLLCLTFRAYNEGAAFRYAFPEQPDSSFVFSGECTQFRFPSGTYGYEAHGTEGEYQRVLTDDIRPWCERPLTLEFANGLYASLSEAANLAYPRMLLSPLGEVPGALVSALGGTTSNTGDTNQRHDPTVRLLRGDATPWRMFIVGQKPGDLLERNYLLLNLNAPCALEDTFWIKPGKVMRDTTLTTENSKAIIDFAATGGLQYTHLDWKWYGTEHAQTGDATTTRVANLDIQEIIRYGREHNVGLIVYVDRRQIKRQRDILFPLYEQWGIAGIKIGFIDVGPQQESAWTTETIAKAAEHRLMLNIHDGYRSTGINRTYPNLMTVEGIRGNEHRPTPEHNCTLPFTRYITGIGDYTVCYFGRQKTTHAHQLAMAVVSFSPLQWIYWYDTPSMYNGEPEIEFFRQIPTVWDDTKVINGEIGRFATIARRSNDDWFIGTINNSEPRRLQISLSFLKENSNYTAYIYFDDRAVKTRTRVGIERRLVNADTVLDAPLKSGGGQAIWITPCLSSEKIP